MFGFVAAANGWPGHYTLLDKPESPNYHRATYLTAGGCMPLDSFGREIDYLRISVIDHCNLRCVYCMPLRDLKFTPSNELLSAAEIEAVVRAAAAVGFRRIRLTGGEPTLRSDLVEIVHRVAGVDGIEDVALTTNGVLLPDMLPALIDAGLTRVNLHVDTLNPDRLPRVMRFGSIDAIWAGIQAVDEAGLKPLKINAAVVRDYNETEVVDLARLTVKRDWHVRFIELMPLGGGECARLSLSQFVPTSETKARIESQLGRLVAVPGTDVADECRNYRIEGASGIVGFISPVSEPYCGTCNRMRLTADGRFHLCLLNDDELDIRSVLRNGRAPGDLQRLILAAVDAKPTGHRLDEGISTRNRAMFQIGG